MVMVKVAKIFPGERVNIQFVGSYTKMAALKNSTDLSPADMHNLG